MSVRVYARVCSHGESNPVCLIKNIAVKISLLNLKSFYNLQICIALKTKDQMQ